MHDIKITSMTILDEEPNRRGNRHLAVFDCEIAGLSLQGCSFFRTVRGGLVAHPPSFMKRGDGRPRCVTIMDDGMRHTFMEAARTVYRAMGGKEAEWTPTPAPERGAPVDLTERESEIGELVDAGLRRFVGAPRIEGEGHE